MSDPLSVAGTAVGIASLGIEVCKGLVNYLTSLQGRNQDIADGLSTLRAHWDSSMFTSKPRQTPGAADASSQLRGPGDPTCSKSKAKVVEMGRSLAYPFREGTLRSLRYSLQNLLGSLNLAISTSSLKQTIAWGEKLGTLGTSMEAESQAQSTALQELQDKVQQSSVRLSDDLLSTTEATRETQWMIRDVSQAMMAKLTLIQTETQRIGSQLAQKQRTEEMLTRNNLHASLAEQTGIHVQPIPDENHQHLPTSISRPVVVASKATSSACDCVQKNNDLKYSFSFGSIGFQFEQKQLKHRRDCVFYGIRRKSEQAITASFPLRLAWFCAQVTMASLQFKRGTNGLGMSIQYHNIVSEMDSPIFKVWENLYGDCLNGELMMIEPLESAQRKILALYRDGHSSPSDRSERDMSHSELFVAMLGDSGRDGTSIFLDHLCEADLVFRTTMKVLKTLLTAIQDYNFKVIRSRKKQFIEWLVSMFEVNPVDVVESFLHIAPCDYRSASSVLPVLMAAAEVTPIGRAIMSRSLVDLEGCISQDPRSVTRKVHGFTTLQLAITWPPGLQRLLGTEAWVHLDDGCPTNFENDLTPFDWAVYHSCLGSVDGLLRAGCDPGLGRRRSRPQRRRMTKSVASLIAYRLAERRKALVALVQRRLGKLGYPDPPHLVDSDAPSLCRALKEAGVQVPKALDLDASYASIYHCRIFSIYEFPILFQQGFRDHMVRNEIGLTPIMVHSIWNRDGASLLSPLPDEDRTSFHALLEWLRVQGFLDQEAEDPECIGINIFATGWHYLGVLIGVALLENYPSEMREEMFLLEDAAQYLSKANVRDECSCLCTRGGRGCSALISLLKTWADCPPPFVYGRDDSFLGMIARFWRKVFIYQQGNAGTKDERVELFMDYVQFLTFKALDMTHTCCELGISSWIGPSFAEPSPWHLKPHHWRQSAGYDIREWVLFDQDEYQTAGDGIEELFEELIVEFEREISSLSPSAEAFEHFLWGFWRQRISEVFAVDQGYLVNMTIYTLKEKPMHLRDLMKLAMETTWSLSIKGVFPISPARSSRTLTDDPTEND
ncbi:hypothetical protein MRS44_015148 [Fusarium solani]|uniref:uncharacterized protein n=1 Tax=Fusarium solani TaxID=169388 RepID=UPI0032C46089|nr:hypothetical protein MRS44_015148 [Fusarium solani]